MGSPENSFDSASFDAQFANIETLEFGGERLPAVDISPEIATGKPVFFALGWNAKLGDYKTVFQKLVEAGRRVISLETTGMEEEKARALIASINLKGLEEVDIIAHSLGAISAVLAALQDSRIKRMVFLNPPVKETDPNNLINKYKEMLSLEGIKNTADVGARKIVGMARVVTSFDMNGFRHRLNGLETRVKSIHGVHDILFPPPETAVQIDEETVKGDHDEFVVDGNHLGIDSFIPYALRILEQK